jgi:acylphosphatase
MAACRRYLIRGRVQGVGFRYFVQKEAVRLGIRGWVRNLDDGRVEALAEGSLAQLAELEGSLHRGPRWAEVRGVDTEEAPAGAPPGFSIV